MSPDTAGAGQETMSACPQCGYDLRAQAQAEPPRGGAPRGLFRCPECGGLTDHGTIRVARKQRRSRRYLLAAGATAMASGVLLALLWATLLPRAGPGGVVIFLVVFLGAYALTWVHEGAPHVPRVVFSLGVAAGCVVIMSAGVAALQEWVIAAALLGWGLGYHVWARRRSFF